MAENVQCTSCASVGTLEYEPELGTLACTRCGTVSTASASHAFESLARVDAEDRYENGRFYVSAAALDGQFGSIGGAQARNAGARVNNWARVTGESREIYQSQKRTEADRFIRRLLTRFDLQQSLFERVQYIFRLARDKVAFRWGRSAELYAAACIYIAARENRKELTLLQLAYAVDVENLFTLTRAVKIVKYELRLTFDETEPALFIEAILAHLNTLFDPKNAPSASTSKAAGLPRLHAAPPSTKRHFSLDNVTWLRSLSLSAVRTLASGLLAFSNETDLTQSRASASIACSVVLVALEGVARTPAPRLLEFVDELAYTVGMKSSTVGERYRALCRALAIYAPHLPWLVGKELGADADDDGFDATPAPPPKKQRKRTSRTVVNDKRGSNRGWKRTLVACTNDIVQWRQAIDAKTARLAREAEKASLQHTEEEEGRGAATPSFTEEAPPDDFEGEVYFADPVFSAAAAPMYSFHTGERSPSAAPTPPLPEPPPHSASVGAAASSKRRASETPGPDNAVGDFETRGAPSEHQVKRARPAEASSGVHTRDQLEYRQLLLAGHAPDEIQAHLHVGEDKPQKQLADPTRPSTRLQRLLWSKPVTAIEDDDELFDEGELDSYLRPKDEVQDLLKLPTTKEMLEAADERERRAAARPSAPPTERRRRFRGRAFSRKVGAADSSVLTPAEAAASGWTSATVLDDVDRGDRGYRGSFGPSHSANPRAAAVRRAGTAESDSFAPRARATKMTAERKQKIDALLAMKGVGDSDDEDFAEQSEDDSWNLQLALKAAQSEGEEVDDEAEQDPSQDWKAQLGYGADADAEDWP